MDITSFLVGFAASSVFFLYQRRKERRVVQKLSNLTLKLEPTRQAVIEQVGDKYHVLDGKTNRFLGEFTSWGKLAELLLSIDSTATWSIKHDLPELDEQYDREN